MNINSNPLVSIFILCYNHEKYVAEAIESVVNQTYLNIEIVIVDNASTDNSRAVIESYAKQDERIKFFPMEYNTLPSYGSNYAIQQCNGEYIAALSADDYFELDKINIQLDYMIKTNLDISFTWINTVDSHSKLLPQNFTEKWFNRNEINTKEDILRFYLQYMNITNAITVMFTKTLLEGKVYDHRLLQTQDYALWIDLLVKTDNFGILKKQLTNYRILDDGSNLSLDKSNIRINRTHFEMIYVFKKFILYPNELLSSILKIEINDENKLECLYRKFEHEKNIYGQLAILLHTFQDLGETCDVRSEKFQFFFENYGKLDIRFLETGSQLEKVSNEKDHWIEELQKGKDLLETQLKNHQKVLQETNQRITDFENSIGYKVMKRIGLIK